MYNVINKLKGHPAVKAETAYAILFSIGFCHLLNDLIQSVIPAIYPLLKSSLGLTFAEIGIVTLVSQITSSIFQPFIGLYADRHPRPYSLSIGMCLMIIGMLLLAFAGDFVSVLLAVAVIGCGSSVFHPEASRVAQMASGGKKSVAQSIFQVGGYCGNACGPLLAALVVIPYGQHAIGWFAIVALVASLLLVHIGYWYSLMTAQWKKIQKMREAAVCHLSRKRVRQCMAILVTMVFSKYFFNACMTNYFTFYLMEKFGVSVQQSQYCLFAYLAAFATGTMLGGFFGDRYGRKYVILFSIFGAAPFTIALPYLNLFWTIAISIVIGLVISSAFSAILVYATDLMPDKVGMVSGVFFGLMFGLGGIGSAFFGWLADRTSVEFIFRVSTWLPLLGIIAAFLPDTRKRAA